jgi:hypothetical protein
MPGAITAVTSGDSELTWVPEVPGQHHRSRDAVNALWGLLDMTPEGVETSSRSLHIERQGSGRRSQAQKQIENSILWATMSPSGKG